jgi:hypothetical protein
MFLLRNTVNCVRQVTSKDQQVILVNKKSSSCILTSSREIAYFLFGLVSLDQLPFSYDVNSVIGSLIVSQSERSS